MTHCKIIINKLSILTAHSTPQVFKNYTMLIKTKDEYTVTLTEAFLIPKYESSQILRTPHPCTYPPVCYEINTGKSLIALCVVDRSDKALRLIKHNLDEFHSSESLNETMPFLYAAKVCLLCQTHEVTDSLNTVCASPISWSILWKCCVTVWECTKSRWVKHPGCCRHTLPPQEVATHWSPWLEEGKTESQNTDVFECDHLRTKMTFYKYHVWH